MKFTERMTGEEREDFSQLKSDEGKRLFIQRFIRKDFYSLVYLLGYRDIGEFHKKEIEEIGRVRWVVSKGVRRIWLWSRGFFKTSLITEAHAIYLIVNNPNIRILLRSNTISIAEDILRNIKNHFISNEDFRYFFKEYCPKANTVGKIEFGTAQDFTVPNRSKTIKEPTMMASGIGTNLTGLHFDYMKLDDLVTKDSVTNDTQIQQSKDDYYSLRHLFDNPSIPREDVVGTIYHFNDLYCDFKKQTGFKFSIIPAKINDDIVFKERINEEALDQLLQDIGPYEFNTQYMLNPINPAEAKFKEEWLKNYEKVPEGCAEYICVDPASTQKKKSDFTVIQRWARDSEGNDYLLEGIRDRLTVFDRIDKVVEMAKRSKRLVFVKYEALGGRHGDLESLQKRFLEENLPIVPKETRATNASKKDRIEQRLVPRFHAGKIFLPISLIYVSKYDGKTKDFVHEYKLEYYQHPFNEHDDILDCHTQMYEDPTQMQSGIKITEKKENKGMTADEWDKFYDLQNNIQKKNPFITKEGVRETLLKRRIRSVIMRALR